MLDFMLNPIVQGMIVSIVTGVISHFAIKAIEWIVVACKEKFARDILEEVAKQEKEQKENKNNKKKATKKKK